MRLLEVPGAVSMTTRASGVEDPRSFRTKRLTLAYFSPKPWPSTRSCQMAMALRPLARAVSMNSRYSSQALADGLLSSGGMLSTASTSPPESVDTSMAGFA
jgi:hypothetical protein